MKHTSNEELNRSCLSKSFIAAKIHFYAKYIAATLSKNCSHVEKCVCISNLILVLNREQKLAKIHFNRSDMKNLCSLYKIYAI